ELTRRGYEAFANGDMATLSELLADDVTWHVDGAGPLSGTYHGRDEVFSFFGRLAEETAGTFRLDVHDVLANDEHAVVLCTQSASRGGKSIEVPVANVSHLRDGKLTEFWGATTDVQASIDFWSREAAGRSAAEIPIPFTRAQRSYRDFAEALERA
ncbi:MAG TPA: nuclear transport factor 2 family protein, partial [Actinomycetes bacterium]|nr:nuclear transport factor 2 family protein [Actinomycetes bacterium]